MLIFALKKHQCPLGTMDNGSMKVLNSKAQIMRVILIIINVQIVGQNGESVTLNLNAIVEE